MTGNSTQKWHEQRLAKGEVVRGGFIVFRRGETTGRVKINPNKLPFEHATLEKATAEALRLSKSNPGIEFCVFHQVVSFTEPRRPEAETVDQPEAEPCSP